MKLLQKPSDRRRTLGFTLLELMITVVVFTIVAGAAFSLVGQHESVSQRELQLSGMNTRLRSAVGQIQMDLANAGEGYFTGANEVTFPIGVVVLNQTPTANCNTGAPTFTYSSTCFDTLNIIQADTSTLPNFAPLALHPSANFTTAAGTILAVPQGADTAATDAAYFKTGDELLLVASNSSASTADCTGVGGAANPSTKFSAVVLTAPGAVSGANVQLTYNALPADGVATPADPLSLTAHCSNELASNAYSFQTSDWIMRLNGISYSVLASNVAGPGSPSDPQLTRTALGVTSVVADQIIGFKVGAALWNAGTGTGTDTDYIYDSSTYTIGGTGTSVTGTGVVDPYDYSLIRSLRFLLIGRTTPVGRTVVVQNPFDGGPYEIEAISTIVNPRNLSMKDQ